eukprot:6721734-Prymnesium_polylepis.1
MACALPNMACALPNMACALPNMTGEEDHGLKRGRPLQLSAERCAIAGDAVIAQLSHCTGARE